MAAHYSDTITTKYGTVLPGALLELLDGVGSPVTLYSDAALTSPVTPVATRVAADNNGRVECYVPDGTYTVRQSYGDVSLTFPGVELYDQSDVKDSLALVNTTKANASALGVAGTANDLGAFTGGIIPDGQTAKQALQSVETHLGNMASLFVGTGDGATDDLAKFQAWDDAGDQIKVIPGGNYYLSGQWQPPVQDVTVTMGASTRFAGSPPNFRNLMPYVAHPLISLDLYRKTYGPEWNGTKNIFQRFSYAEAAVPRGGVNVGPAVVAFGAMGELTEDGAAVWAVNLIGVASAVGTAITNESDSLAMVPGAIAVNTVLGAAGPYPSKTALQIQTNQPTAVFETGIFFNNRQVGAINGTYPIDQDIPAVSGTLIYADSGGTSERFIRSLMRHTITEWESRNFIIGPSYTTDDGTTFPRYGRLDVTAGGVYLRARDTGDAATNLYLASVDAGSVIFLTGRTGSGGEVPQVEIGHTAGATERLTLTGSTGDVAIGTAGGTATNSSVSISGRGSNAGVKLRDAAGNLKFQVNNTGLGFYGATPVAKPTGVPVSAAGIHAALVSLGLIAA